MANPVEIVNYGTLEEAVRAYLEEQDVDTNDVALWVSLVESDFENEIRIENLSDRISDSSTEEVITVPDGFFETIILQVNQGGRFCAISYRDPVSFYETGYADVISVPREYTRIGDEFILSPLPGGDIQYKLSYYKYDTPLDPATPTSTNTLLAKEPNLYLFGVLKKAAQFFDDDRNLAKWTGFYEQTKQTLHSADARARYRPGLRERAVMTGDRAWLRP